MTYAIRSEWIKLRSLRSTWYTVACLFVVGLGITALTANGAGQAYADDPAAWDPTAHSLRAYIVAQLIVGVLGVLVVTSEFATGLIRTSLTAMPRRGRLLTAKVLVAAGVALVAGQVLMLASFLIGQPLIHAQGVPYARLGDPGVVPAIVAGGLYLALIALLAVGLGTILRATAGALTTLVGIVFLVPAMAGLFPAGMQPVFDFWPTIGGSAAMATVPNADYPHPWWNLVGLAAGVTAVLAAAFVVLRRRDV